MKIKEILNNPNLIKIAAAILLMLVTDTFLIVSIKSLWAKNSGLAREVKSKTFTPEVTKISDDGWDIPAFIRRRK